ncbi:MAG: hypothetical protein ABIP35_06350 [Ginsengibacter sp.]
MDNPFQILIDKLDKTEITLQKMQAKIDLLMEEKKEKYLSPEEARQMFNPKISPSTLHRWQQSGLVKRHFIGKKVCYKLSEIQDSIKTLKPYKAKAPIEIGASLQ